MTEIREVINMKISFTEKKTVINQWLNSQDIYLNISQGCFSDEKTENCYSYEEISNVIISYEYKQDAVNSLYAHVSMEVYFKNKK